MVCYSSCCCCCCFFFCISYLLPFTFSLLQFSILIKFCMDQVKYQGLLGFLLFQIFQICLLRKFLHHITFMFLLCGHQRFVLFQKCKCRGLVSCAFIFLSRASHFCFCTPIFVLGYILEQIGRHIKLMTNLLN